MIFKFLCPSCGQKLETSAGDVGAPVTCPSCAFQFSTPAPDSHVALRPPLASLRGASSAAALERVDEDSPLPLRQAETASGRSSMGGVDEEVERILDGCDPALLEPLADEKPVPAPAAANTGAGSRWRLAWIPVVVAVLAGIVVCGVLVVPRLRRGRSELRDVPRMPGVVPPVREAPPPEVPEQWPATALPMSESACVQELGAQSQEALPLSRERAVAIRGYLKDFPTGEHRDLVLALAMREATRCLASGGSAAEPEREMYLATGEGALREMLAREPEDQSGVAEMRVYVAALCREDPTEERLDWAISIDRMHADAPVENVPMLLAGLSERTPASHRQALAELVFVRATEIPPGQWNESLRTLMLPRARYYAEHEPERGQSILRLARRLHEAGWDDESFYLLRLLRRYHPSGELRHIASRLLLSWDRGAATVAREGVMEEVRKRHREELPAVLAMIDQKALAARFGLPWPLPPAPTQSVAEVMAAATAKIDEQIEQEYPASRAAEIRAKSKELYRPFRIGQDVKLEIRRGNQVVEVVEGRLHSLSPSHARVGSRNVLLIDLGRLDRVRFDPELCERERQAYIEQQEATLVRQRDATRRVLSLRATKEAPLAAGYMLWQGHWVNPQELFSRALENMAEAKSKELLRQVSEEMLARAGFSLQGGEWLPTPPPMPKD